MRLIASRNLRKWCVEHCLPDPVCTSDLSWFLESEGSRAMFVVTVSFASWFDGDHDGSLKQNWKTNLIKMTEMVDADQFTIQDFAHWAEEANTQACFELMQMCTSGLYPIPTPVWRHQLSSNNHHFVLRIERVSRYHETYTMLMARGVEESKIKAALVKCMADKLKKEDVEMSDELSYMCS
jgi:hypothetical protein